MAHRETWIFLQGVQECLTSDETVRCSPHKNQIDYILCKNIHKVLFQVSRSYSGTFTLTDIKIVIETFLKIVRWKIKQWFKKSERININNLKDPTTQKNFAAELNQKLTQNHIEHMVPNKSWKTVAMTC